MTFIPISTPDFVGSDQTETVFCEWVSKWIAESTNLLTKIANSVNIDSSNIQFGLSSPPIPASNNIALYQYFDRLREEINKITGASGNPLDGCASYNDINLGFAAFDAATSWKVSGLYNGITSYCQNRAAIKFNSNLES